MSLTIDAVHEALKDVMDPEINKPLLDLKMIDDIVISGQDLSLTVYLTTPACPLKEKIKNDVTEALDAVPNIGKIDLKIDSRTLGGQAPQEIATGVKNFVAVASGKGGVGKSTTALNVALALSAKGAKVGLLDADIFGPSIPHMVGAGDHKPEVIQEGKILPLEIHGLKVMSIGFFVPADQAVVWRGPMLHKAIRQCLGDVNWGDLDYLIIDFPPGTGDVQLSIAQLIPLTGALVVSTPQDVALLDVRKCLAMFEVTKTKIFGMVENMSFFRCPECGHNSFIFGKEGAIRQAEQINAPLLGQVPIRLAIREGGDEGKPPFLTDATCQEDYVKIAENLAAQISMYHLSGAQPQILQAK